MEMPAYNPQYTVAVLLRVSSPGGLQRPLGTPLSKQPVTQTTCHPNIFRQNHCRPL